MWPLSSRGGGGLRGRANKKLFLRLPLNPWNTLQGLNFPLYLCYCIHRTLYSFSSFLTEQLFIWTIMSVRQSIYIYIYDNDKSVYTSTFIMWYMYISIFLYDCPSIHYIYYISMSVRPHSYIWYMYNINISYIISIFLYYCPSVIIFASIWTNAFNKEKIRRKNAK